MQRVKYRKINWRSVFIVFCWNWTILFNLQTEISHNVIFSDNVHQNWSLSTLILKHKKLWQSALIHRILSIYLPIIVTWDELRTLADRTFSANDRRKENPWSQMSLHLKVSGHLSCIEWVSQENNTLFVSLANASLMHNFYELTFYFHY